MKFFVPNCEFGILLLLGTWTLGEWRDRHRSLIHQLHDCLEVVLLSGRVAVPLVLLWTETGVAHWHVTSVHTAMVVLTSGRVVLCQVVLHHTGVWPATGEHCAVTVTPEVGLRCWLRITNPGQHLLESGEPNILVRLEMVQETIQSSYVSSVKSKQTKITFDCRLISYFCVNQVT